MATHTRDFYKSDKLLRAAEAKAGTFGNDALKRSCIL